MIPFPHFAFGLAAGTMGLMTTGRSVLGTRSKHSASKEMTKNYPVYSLHSSKYVDETVVYGETKC